MSGFKKFIIQFSHFFSGNVLVLLFGFITFPILTRYLPKDDYGILGLVTITMTIVVAIAKAGLSDGIIRFYGDYKKSEEDKSVFTSTVFWRGLLFSTTSVILYLMLFPLIYDFLNIEKKFLFSFLLMSVYLFVRPMNIIVFNLLRVNGKTIFINIINILEKAFSVGLSLVLLIYIFNQIYGYFIGVILSEIIISIILFTWFFITYKVTIKKVSKDLAIRLIKFGAPLLLSEISYLILSYIDRYMIVYYHDEAMLGLYTVGYNLAMYVAGIITFSLSYAIVPVYVEIYNTKGKQGTEEFLERSMYFLLVGIIPICFGYYSVSKNLFIVLASTKYAEASLFSPIILVATIMLGINSVLNAGLYINKKSTHILAVMLSAVIINIILNVILLPGWGVMGATIATLLACVFSTILTIYLSYKYIVIRVHKKILYHICISIFMCLVLSQIKMQTPAISLVSQLMIGILIILTGVLIREKEISFHIFTLIKKICYRSSE